MKLKANKPAGGAGFTLAETLISVTIMGLVFSGVLLGYTRGTQRAEWTGYSLAAQAICQRTMEQFRAVLWDTQVYPVRDDTTNIPNNTVTILDIPISGTNVVWATNKYTITQFTLAGPSYIKMITINTSWLWPATGRIFTNTLVCYRAPDQ